MTVEEGPEYELDQWRKMILSSLSPSVARRWYFTNDPNREGTLKPVEPAILWTTPEYIDEMWTNKGSLNDVPKGWYWVVFCVSLDGLALDQISTMSFDVQRGNAVNRFATTTTTCLTRLSTDEIQFSLKERAATGMVRLRLHRQLEVTGNDEYLHLTIGGKLRSTFQPEDFPLFTLHYVELGTNVLHSAAGVADYVLYGEESPQQYIMVDRSSNGEQEKPTATTIRSYGLSDNADFAVTLHLRDIIAFTNAPEITIDASDGDIVPTNATDDSPGVRAVISVWDLKPLNSAIDDDLRARRCWEPIQYSIPCAEIDISLPDDLALPDVWEHSRASVSISTNGTKVAVCGIDKLYGHLPFTAFDCNPPTNTDRIGESRTLIRNPPCRELETFSGCGGFHRINTNDSKPSNDDNERFITFNGSVLEVYEIKTSGWTRLQRITLAQNFGTYRLLSDGFVQGLRGRYFAWPGVSGIVSLWDISRGKLVRNIIVDIDPSAVHAVFSPDGSKLAILMNQSVHIYESATGILISVRNTGSMFGHSPDLALGNEYFDIRDDSRTSHESTKVRSVVRIRDMQVVGSYELHRDYRIMGHLPSTTTIASYKRGSVLNIRRMTGIGTPREEPVCTTTPCDPETARIYDFIDKMSTTFPSAAGEVFVATCFQELRNGCCVMTLKITLKDGSIDIPTSFPKSMVLPLGDSSAEIRGFYLPETSKLVIFAEGYMKIWTLSTTATHICQLDYIWDTLTYQPERAQSFCHRSLLVARSCKYGSSMRFRLGKPVWYDNDMIVEGNPTSTEYDILTVPPNLEVETVDTTEAQRLEYGIISVVYTYRYGDRSCKKDIIRYLLAYIRPSTINPTSCLIPLCRAWSKKNRDALLSLVSELLSGDNPTWIPEPCSTVRTDPLATLLDIAKYKRSVIELVRVLIDYLISHAGQTNNMVFLLPLFKSMPDIMDMYPEDARECLGRIAYIPANHPAYIWENHVTCQNVTPFRPPLLALARRIWISKADMMQQEVSNTIMQFKLRVGRNGGDHEDNLEKPIFVATFDALWIRKDVNVRSRNRRIEGGRHEKHDNTIDAIDDIVVAKTTWWKVPFQVFWIKIFIRPPAAIQCHNLNLAFLDNPATDTLITFKWETVGYPYWCVRFFCQVVYYTLTLAAALMQVYHPEPSKLYRVFIAIITMGAFFITLQILQAIQDWRRYFSFGDVVAFGVPMLAGVQQVLLIHTHDTGRNNRILSFSVLVSFLHLLLELRISRSVCKVLTIIQQAVAEIWIFLGIFAGCLVAFTITLLHLRRSCAHEGCMQDDTEYPKHFIGALSTTYFFLGGRYDVVAHELDSTDDWSFHLVMSIFLLTTTILLLNVLIALINVAFVKGNDSWRLAWIKARLRYIESAENLSHQIPGFRETYDWFPNQIYFTATAKEMEDYLEKHPSSASLRHTCRTSGEVRGADILSPFGTYRGSVQPSETDSVVAGVGKDQARVIGGQGTKNDRRYFDVRQRNTILKTRQRLFNSPGSFSSRPRPSNLLEEHQTKGSDVENGEDDRDYREAKDDFEKESNPSIISGILQRLDRRMEDVLLQTQEAQRQAQESERQAELNRQQIQALTELLVQFTKPSTSSSTAALPSYL